MQTEIRVVKEVNAFFYRTEAYVIKQANNKGETIAKFKLKLK